MCNTFETVLHYGGLLSQLASESVLPAPQLSICADSGSSVYLQHFWRMEATRPSHDSLDLQSPSAVILMSTVTGM